jgi:hypothetical protein
MNLPAEKWPSPEWDKVILALKAEGLTSSQIGEKLGLSKGQVCGRTDRLLNPDRPKARGGKRDPVPPPAGPVTLPPLPSVPRSRPIPPPVRSLAGARTCQFVTSDRPLQFCGGAVHHRSLCFEHFSRCYVQRPARVEVAA